MNSSWVGATPECLVGSPAHDRVVFTLGNSKYQHLVRPWSARLASFGWNHQLFIALDEDAANASRRAVPDLCTVDFHGEFRLNGDTKRLPPTVGIAKFSMMLYLLRQGHGAVVLTEMDVVWFRDPWPAIGHILEAQKFVAQENYPWEPTQANIGFVAASPHQLTFDLFDHVRVKWLSHCNMVQDTNLTIQVAADQKILNEVLRHHGRQFTRTLNIAHIRFVLDRFEFPSLNLQERGGGLPTLSSLRKMPNGLNVWFDPEPKAKRPQYISKYWHRWLPAVSYTQPHLHLKDSLRVLHVTGVREVLKIRLLELLYHKEVQQGHARQVVTTGPTIPPTNLSLSSVATFCRATWGEIVAHSRKLEVAQHGAIQRGDMHVVRDFMSSSELALLRKHLASPTTSRALELAEVRTSR